MDCTAIKKNNSIKHWPENERPRDMILKKGTEYVSDAGLIAALLGSGTKGKDAVSLGRELLKQFGGLRGLLNANAADIKRIKGLGEAKIAKLIACSELAKRQLKQEIIGKSYIKSDKDVFDYLSLSMKDLGEEVFKVIFLNNASTILSVDVLFKGTVNKAVVYPRKVIRKAFETGATAVIFAHNHPCGNLKPSKQDLDITRKLVSACNAVEIQTLDHIILSPFGYFSFKRKGLI